MLLLALLSCKADSDKIPDKSIDYSAPGPWTPARRNSLLDDTARDRSLSIEIWYPSDAEAGTGSSILDFIASDTERASYAALLEAAPPDCPSHSTQALVNAPLAFGDPWPLIALSHCSGCTRFSTAQLAEHLASYGFVVVAPDHAGNTLFDTLAGTGLPLNAETLTLREADLGFALDAALNGDLEVAVDPARVGVLGHSFGAVTAALLLQNRLGDSGAPLTGMFIGAPPENPLLPGVQMERLRAPLLFEVLTEDHSIGLAGNFLIQSNYEAAPGPAWWVEMADAGHWSPSDLVGLTEDFMPGCGEDSREATGENFAYLPPSEGKALTASIAAAFFSRYLNGATEAEAWLKAAPEGLNIENH